MVRESAVDFVRRAETLKQMRAARTQGWGFPPQLRSTMREAGWFGLLVPEELGGAGAEHADVAALCEELGKGLAEGPILQESVLLATALLSTPASGLRAELLAGLVAGELSGVLAFGADSPAADWRAPALKARRAGSGFVLEGSCSRVRVTHEPTGFLIGAQAPAGPVLCWLPRDAENLELGQQWLVDGTGACELRAEGVRLPRGLVLAEGESAAQALEEALDVGAVMAAAALLGVSGAAAELTREYLCTRVQFGRPIGSFQALAHRAVDQYIQQQLAQDALDAAAAALARTKAGEVARVKVVARAKARCSDAAMKITRESIQMHGAMGFTDEYDVGLFLRRTLALSGWLGNATQHRRRYAELQFPETR